MNSTIQTLHFIGGFIVLAEALNKLERTNPCACSLDARERVTEWLKALAWLLLAIGAGGALATPVLLLCGVQSAEAPLLRLEPPTIAETAVLLGFATLIVRTRIKEG
ncbi:hypothetical protein [Limnohabitans sp.]|uniref:hypothetical protein n=1 Tax=Limnohabitans sp. TaxID=1907725 RepID=UPI00286F145D|nr:hypothetical protein [Limnohabitans sp.]